MTETAPQDRIDPNVKVPAAVARAAARSEELAKQQFAQEPPADAGEAAPEVHVEAPASGDTQMHAAPAPQVKERPETFTKAPASEENWEHRYNSMKGRYEQIGRAHV